MTETQGKVRQCHDADGAGPRFSLITATLGRPELFRRLVRSLVKAAANGADFEHIVVDMDPEQRTLAVLQEEVGGSYPWTYVPSTSRGGAKKRNEGWAVARGDIVGFPDDDVWYPGSTLARISEEFRAQPTLVGLTGRLSTVDGRDCDVRWARSRRLITKTNVHRTSVGATIFYRREALEHTGHFDDSIGTGTDGWFAAGDETDLVLRMLRVGPVMYEPTVVIHHDHRDDVLGTDRAFDSDKMLRYGSGAGRLWRRHHYSRFLCAWLLFRKLVKIAILWVARDPQRAKVEAAWARGAVLGLLGRDPTGIGATRPTDPAAGHDHDDLTGEARSSFRWRLVLSVAGLSASLLLSVIVVRRLPAPDVTAFFLLMTALMVAPVLGRLGFGSLAVREISAARGNGDMVAASAIAVRILEKTVVPGVACGALLAAGLVALAHPEHGMATGVLTAIIVTAEVFRAMLSDLFLGLGRARLSAALTHNVRAVLVAATVGAVVLATDDLTLLEVLVITALASSGLLALGFGRFRSVAGPSAGRQRAVVARTGLWFLVVDGVGVLMGRGDVWFAAWGFEPHVSATYAAASTLAAQVSTPTALATIALAPVISSMWASSRMAELEQLLRAVVTLAALLAVATVLFIALFGRQLLGLGFGDGYQDAYGSLVILTVGSGFVAVLGPSLTVLLMTGFERAAAGLSVAFILVAATAMAATARLMGPQALAVASTLSTVVFIALAMVTAYVATGIAVVPTRLRVAIDVLRRERRHLAAVAGG